MGAELNPFEAPKVKIIEAAEPVPHSTEPLADRTSRLVAAIVDTVLYAVVLLPAWAASASEQADLVILLGAVGLIGLACFQWYLVSTTGQSIAKRWFDLRIVRDDGTPVGFVHGVVLRVWVTFAAGLLPAAGGLLALVDPLMIFGKQRKCLHDHIAGTKVISVEPWRPEPLTPPTSPEPTAPTHPLD